MTNANNDHSEDILPGFAKQGWRLHFLLKYTVLWYIFMGLLSLNHSSYAQVLQRKYSLATLYWEGLIWFWNPNQNLINWKHQ